MKGTYWKWSLEEKRSAVAGMESVTHGALAAELGVERSVLYHSRGLSAPFGSEGQGARTAANVALERENLRLKQALATKVLEADFLQGVLRRIEARRQPTTGSGETGIYEQVQVMRSAAHLSIESICRFGPSQHCATRAGRCTISACCR